LNREFQAERAGAKRVPDIACPRTLGGWIYLTAVLDLFDRKVIGRAFSSGMETAFERLLSRGSSEHEPERGTAQAFARAESIFKTLKRELETLDGRHTAGEVRQSVFMYLEAYYNRVRPHSALDCVPPDMINSGRVA
jgi:transposase InsO family protein